MPIVGGDRCIYAWGTEGLWRKGERMDALGLT